MDYIIDKCTIFSLYSHLEMALSNAVEKTLSEKLLLYKSKNDSFSKLFISPTLELFFNEEGENE